MPSQYSFTDYSPAWPLAEVKNWLTCLEPLLHVLLETSL